MKSKLWTRTISTLMLLFMLASFSSHAAAATTVWQADSSANSHFTFITSAQAVQDSFYVIADGKLASLSQIQSEPKLMIDFSTVSGMDWTSLQVASDGTALYVLDSLGGLLYRVQDTALEQVVRLNISEMGTQMENGQRYVDVFHPIIASGFLYVVYMNPQTYGQSLYRFSLADGKSEQVSTNTRQVTEIAPYKAGQLLAFDPDTTTVMAIDAETGKKLGDVATLNDYNAGAIAYAAKTDDIYYISGTSLMKCGAQQPADHVPFDGGFSSVYACIWNEAYIVLDSSGLFTCTIKAEKSDAEPITLWLEPNSFPDTGLITKYNLQNPMHPIVLRNTNGVSSSEFLTTVNMTKDTDVDIYAMQSYDIDIDAMIRRGFIAPLDSELLKADVLTMYPQIREYLMKDETLYAYPVYLYPDFYTVSPTLLEEAALGEAPKTMDDYLDMMLCWYEEYHHSATAYTFDGSATVQDEWRKMVDLLVNQYVKVYATNSEPISFNTPVFKSALEKLAKLSTWKTSSVAGTAEVTPERQIFHLDAQSPFGQSNSSDAQYIPLPTFQADEQPVLNASIMYFVINPNSPRKESAEKFIAFYSQNMELMLNYMLHPEYNDLVETQEYEAFAWQYAERISEYEGQIAKLAEEDDQAIKAGKSATHEAALLGLRDALAQEEVAFNKLKEKQWVFTADEIAAYRGLAPFISFEHNVLSWAISEDLGAGDILMRYLEGATPLEQTLKALDQKVEMMFYEQQ